MGREGAGGDGLGPAPVLSRHRPGTQAELAMLLYLEVPGCSAPVWILAMNKAGPESILAFMMLTVC